MIPFTQQQDANKSEEPNNNMVSSKEVHHANEELNMFALPKESDRTAGTKGQYNVDIDSVQELHDAEKDGSSFAPQQQLFIHPDDLKDWKKFQAKAKKEKQEQYNQTVRTKVMRSTHNKLYAKVGGVSPPRNFLGKDLHSNKVSESGASKSPQRSRKQKSIETKF